MPVVSVSNVADAGQIERIEKLVKAKQLREAQRQLAKAIAATPTDRELLKRQARLSARLRDMPVAFASAAAAIALLKPTESSPSGKVFAVPPSAQAAFDAGFVLWRLESYAKALVHFERAQKEAPRFGRPRFYIAYCHCNMRRTDECIDGLLRAADADPANSERFEALATLRHRVDDWAGVLRVGDEAARAGVKSPRLLAHRALAKATLSSKPEEGLAFVDEAIALDPALVTSHHVRAYLLLLAKRLDDAKATLKRALELNVDVGRTAYLLAGVAAAETDWPRAESFARQALASDPDDVSAAILLARVLGAQKRQAEMSAAHLNAVRLRARQSVTSDAFVQPDWPEKAGGLVGVGQGFWMTKLVELAHERGEALFPFVASREEIERALRSGTQVIAFRSDADGQSPSFRASWLVGFDSLRETFITVESDWSLPGEIDRSDAEDALLFAVASKDSARPATIAADAYAVGRGLLAVAVRLANGDSVGARERLNALPEKGSRLVMAELMRAYADLAEKRLDGFVKALAGVSAISRGALGEAARLLRVQALLEIKRRADATALAKEIVRRAPRHGYRADDLNRVGLILKGAGLHDLAVEAFEKAHLTDSKNELYLLNAGLVQRDSHQLARAVETLRRALAIAPRRADIRTEAAAMMLADGGDDGEIMRELEQATGDDPTNVRAFYLQGIISSRVYDLPDARDRWRRMMALPRTALHLTIFSEVERMMIVLERLIAARGTMETSLGTIVRVNHEEIADSTLANTAPTQVRASLEVRILSKLRAQEIERWAIAVTDVDVDDAVVAVRLRHKATPAEFEEIIKRDGFTVAEYRMRMRGEIEESRLVSYIGPKHRTLDDYIDWIRARAWVVVDDERLARIEAGKW